MLQFLICEGGGPAAGLTRCTPAQDAAVGGETPAARRWLVWSGLGSDHVLARCRRSGPFSWRGLCQELFLAGSPGYLKPVVSLIGLGPCCF